MINYYIFPEGFTLTEENNDNDYEFIIAIHDIKTYLPAMALVCEQLERESSSRVYIYYHQNNEYQFIVRHDYYIDFILCLFKSKFICSVKWI